ncbi:MAG: apolipoprotein N-acyltransferase [Planctomycetaceae bacterium]
MTTDGVEKRACVLAILLPLAMPFLGGTLLGLCFDQPRICWLSFVALVPFVWTVSRQASTLWLVSAAGGLFAFHLIGLRFLPASGNLEAAQWWPWLAVCLTAFSFPFLLIGRMLSERLRLNIGLVFPLVWVALESGRSWMMAPLLGAPFPYLHAGTTLCQSSELLQCADLAGVPGLTLLVCIASAGLASLFSRFEPSARRYFRLAAVCGCILLCGWGYGFVRLRTISQTEGPTVALVSGSPVAAPERLPDSRGPLPGTSAQRVDLIVWPELAFPGTVSTNSNVPATDSALFPVIREAEKHGAVLVFGTKRCSSNPDMPYNAMCVVQPYGRNVQSYDKRYLSPGYDFQPPVARWLSFAAGTELLSPGALNWTGHTAGGRADCFSVADRIGKTQYRFCGSICYDLWFSSALRESATAGDELPDFLVNIADEVFSSGRNVSYADWALVQARLRAIETRRALVRTSGEGTSFAVDACGRVLARSATDSYVKDPVTLEIPLCDARSPYLVAGDLLPFTALAVCVWVTLAAGTARRRHLTSDAMSPVVSAGDSYADLSIIVPVFNEEQTISALLHRVRRAAPDAQVIVVDDGSSDGTHDLLQSLRQPLRLIVQRHPENSGKGTAIRTGLACADRKFTLIQDADEEYFPEDYDSLLEPMRRGVSPVVYGSRYLSSSEWPRPKRRVEDVAIRCLNLATLLLFARCITDEATCYKLFATSFLRSLDLRCRRFEFCPEVTAKVCRIGVEIVEVPVRYAPRSCVQGKKIRWQDGFAALWELIRWRFKRMPAVLTSGWHGRCP